MKKIYSERQLVFASLLGTPLLGIYLGWQNLQALNKGKASKRFGISIVLIVAAYTIICGLDIVFAAYFGERSGNFLGPWLLHPALHYSYQVLGLNPTWSTYMTYAIPCLILCAWSHPLASFLRSDSDSMESFRDSAARHSVGRVLGVVVFPCLLAVGLSYFILDSETKNRERYNLLAAEVENFDEPIAITNRIANIEELLSVSKTNRFETSDPNINMLRHRLSVFQKIRDLSSEGLIPTLSRSPARRISIIDYSGLTSERIKQLGKCIDDCRLVNRVNVDSLYIMRSSLVDGSQITLRITNKPEDLSISSIVEQFRDDVSNGGLDSNNLEIVVDAT